MLNDEAHHVHDEKLKWNQTIERLHDELRTRAPDDPGAGVVSQLDFSATPKYEKGGVFRHIVVDYPLAQAVADGIVKTPVIGEVSRREGRARRHLLSAQPAMARRRGRPLAGVRREALACRASGRCCS